MSNDTIIILVFAIGGAALAVFIYLRMRAKAKNKTESVYDNLPIKFPKVFPHTYTTPKDVWVSSVVPIPETKREAVFNAIDAGITNQLTATGAKFPHWQKKRTHYDYNVAFIEPDRTNQDGSPAILVGGIQSAGTVIGVGNDKIFPSNIVLPHQAATDWAHLDYLMHSAWYESEHDAEWGNDANVFYQYVGAGDIHPHHPLPDAPKGFFAKSPFRCGVR